MFLGVISYGIYLWHVVVIDETLKLNVFGVRHTFFAKFNFFEVTVVTLVFTVILATLSWYALEKPVIAFSHRPGRLPAAVDRKRRRADSEGPARSELPLAADGVVAFEPTATE